MGKKVKNSELCAVERWSAHVKVTHNMNFKFICKEWLYAMILGDFNTEKSILGVLNNFLGRWEAINDFTMS